MWEPSIVETILIVDDEPEIRGLVRYALQEAGYGVLEAGNGVEAQETLQIYGGRIGLVISDIRMPGGNGLDFAVYLHTTSPETRILYISGLVDSIAVECIFRKDPMAILTKPFTTEELLARVRALQRPAMEQGAGPQSQGKGPGREAAAYVRDRRTS